MIYDSFQFLNLEPADDETRFVGLAIDRLYELAPYSARIYGTLGRDEAGFNCCLSIFSPAGTFHAMSTSAKFNETIDVAVAKLKVQLVDWKSRRFTGAPSQVAAPMAA